MQYLIETQQRMRSYIDQGKFLQASLLVDKYVMLALDVFGESHLNLAVVYYDCAIVQRRLGEFDDAKASMSRAVELYRDNGETRSARYDGAIHFLAIVHTHIGEFVEAEQLYRESMSIRAELFGKDHAEYASSLHGLGTIELSLGKLDSAEKYFLSALNIRETHPDATAQQVATTLNCLGGLYREKGMMAEAADYWEKSCDIRKHDAPHPDYATVLKNLAGAYSHMARFDESIDRFRQAKEIFDLTLGPESSESIGCLQRMAIDAINKGDFVLGHRFAQDVYRISGSANVAPLVHAESMHVLSMVKRGHGDYAESLRLEREAVEIRKHEQGEHHRDYANGLLSLSDTYGALEQSSREEECLTEAIRVFRPLLDAHSRHKLATALTRAFYMYKGRGEYDKAVECINEATDIRAEILGVDHVEYGESVMAAAWVAGELGRPDEANELYALAEKTIRSAGGTASPLYSPVLANWGVELLRQGKTVAAVTKLQAAYDLVLLEPLNMGTLEVQKNLAMARSANGEHAAAMTLFEAIEGIQSEFAATVCACTSEGVLMNFLRETRTSMEAHLSLLIAEFSGSCDAVGKALELCWKRKGIVAEVLLQRQLTLENNPDLSATAKNEFARLREVSIALADLVLNDKQSSIDGVSVAALAKEKSDLQERVAEEFPRLALFTEMGSKIQEVIASLPDRSVVLEYIRYRRWSMDQCRAEEDCYAAFVIGEDHETQVFALGSAKIIDAAVQQYRESLSAGENFTRDISVKRKEAQSAEPELERLILAPIVEQLRGVSHVYVCPDGALNVIPFEALRISEGVLFAEFVESVSYLNVGREIIGRPSLKESVGGKPLVVGNPDFDLGADLDSEDSDTKSEVAFRILKGSEVEADYIGSILGVKPLIGRNALKGWIRRAVSPQIVHFATHGFFVGEFDENLTGTRLGRLGIEDPMLRSGIALAGANAWMNRKGHEIVEDVENGVLTSEELSKMNLSGTQLATISTCQSGLGEIEDGEGIFGLRRAFFVAGARAALVSLWSVDDVATMILMCQFYHELVENGSSGIDAITRAKQFVRSSNTEALMTNSAVLQQAKTAQSDWVASQLRRYPNEIRPFESPLYWAAFIYVGQPNIRYSCEPNEN